MKWIAAAYYEMLKNSRDYKMTAILLVFPIIAIYILGNVTVIHDAADVMNTLSVESINQTIERIHYTSNETMPSMIDYYSVMTLLQMLIIGAIFGVNIMHKSAKSDLQIRYQSLPISRWSLHMGQVTGSVIYLFILSTAILLFTKYVYGANWDGNFLIIAATMLVFCAIAIGMGLLIGNFVKSVPTALMIVMLLMMFFSKVSGAITPLGADEIWGTLTPNHHAKNIIFGTIYGYETNTIAESALWLGGFLLVIYGAVAVCIGRMRHDNL